MTENLNQHILTLDNSIQPPDFQIPNFKLPDPEPLHILRFLQNHTPKRQGAPNPPKPDPSTQFKPPRMEHIITFLEQIT